MKEARQGFLLQLAILLFGAFTLSAQILLLRELLVFSHGDELVLGIQLGVYLLWGAAGSWIGAGLVRRPRWPVGLLLFSMLLAALLLPATLFALVQVRPLLGALAVQTLTLPQLLATFPLLLGPFCLVTGATFPLAVSTLARSRPGETGAVRRIYLLEAAGGGLGALAIHWLLTPYLQPINLACFLGAMASVGALLVALASGGGARVALAAVAGLLGLFGLVGASSETLRQARAKIQWRGMTHIASASTAQGRLDATRQGGQVHLYQSGRLMASSAPSPGAAALAHLALLQAPAAQRVLILGGCRQGLAGVLSRRGVGQVTCMEPNPEMAPFAVSHLGPLKPGQGSVVGGDPRRLIHKERGLNDLIVMRLGDPAHLLTNRFYTRESFLDLARALRRRGVLLFEVSSSSLLLTPEHVDYLASLRRTLASAFDRVALLPGETCVFMAANGRTLQLEPSRDASQGHRPYLDQLLRRNMPVSREELERQVQAATARVRPNLDLEPAGYLYHLVQALGGEHSQLKGVAAAFMDADPVLLFLLPLGLGLLFLPGALRGRGARWPAALCLGLSSITSQVILLLGYQVIHGQLYQGMGMILALFMVGLALGAALSGRGIAGRWIRIPVLVAGCLFPLALALLLCWQAPARAAFIALGLGGGLVSGALFPLLIEVWGRGDDPRLAGRIYGLDLLGASLGAVLAGPLLLASLGLRTTCLWLALLSVACYLPILFGAKGICVED